MDRKYNKILKSTKILAAFNICMKINKISKLFYESAFCVSLIFTQTDEINKRKHHHKIARHKPHETATNTVPVFISE